MHQRTSLTLRLLESVQEIVEKFKFGCVSTQEQTLRLTFSARPRMYAVCQYAAQSSNCCLRRLDLGSGVLSLCFLGTCSKSELAFDYVCIKLLLTNGSSRDVSRCRNERFSHAFEWSSPEDMVGSDR